MESNPIGEFAAAVNDLANGDPEPEPEPAPAGDSPSDKPEDPEVEIDGEKVPLSKVREWKNGHLMQSDYQRKTAELARAREAAEARGRVMESLRTEYEKAIANLRGNTQEQTDDVELSPATKRAIDRLEKKYEEITGNLQRENEQREAQATDNYILQVAESTIKTAMSDAKMPAYMFDRVQKYIAGQNPDLYDPISGKLTEASIKEALLREFKGFHSDLERWRKESAGATLNSLKKESPRKPELRSAAPAKDGEKPKPFQWDSAANVDRLQDILARQKAEPGY